MNAEFARILQVDQSTHKHNSRLVVVERITCLKGITVRELVIFAGTCSQNDFVVAVVAKLK